MVWDVHVIEYARSKDQLVAGIIHGAHDGTVVDLPFSFVLARSGERVVLVDSGFIREGSGAAFADKFGIPFWISPLRMLGEVGVGARDVTDIIVSHAHFDHMGGIGAFPRAQIHLQKREYLSTMELLALPRQFGALTEIINPDDVRTAFDASIEHRLSLVDGDRDNFFPGLHLRFGPGHTPGQQFVVVETSRGAVVIAGDCVYSKRNICGHDGSGVYAPLANAVGSTWDQLVAMDRIREAIDGDLTRLVILHDSDRWAHLTPVAEVDGFGIFRV